MGVWERFGVLLAGGAKVELALEATGVAAGSFVSGQARLSGGRKGIEAVGVHVSLVCTTIRPPGGSTTSEIVQRAVVDTTIAAGLSVGSRSTRDVAFSFRAPKALEPSDDDTSYRVRVEVELDGARSPRTTAPLKIFAAASGRPTQDQILQAYAGLHASAPEEQVAALTRLRWEHDATEPGTDLLAAQSELAARMREGPTAVRIAALEAWSTIVAGRVGEEHVHRVARLIAESRGADPDAPPSPWTVALVEAAGRMAAPHLASVLEPLAADRSADIRRTVAQAAGRLDASAASRSLLVALAADVDGGVRAAAWQALGESADDAAVVGDAVAHIAAEPVPAVLDACIALLERSYAHGHAALARGAMQRLAQHDDATVRVSVARALYIAEQDEASLAIASALLDDEDPEVRYTAAAELRNLPVRGRTLCGRLEAMATADPSARARRGALTSLPAFAAADRLAAHFAQLIDGEPPLQVLHGIIDGIRFRSEPQYRALLDRLAEHPDTTVARDARTARRDATGQ